MAQLQLQMTMTTLLLTMTLMVTSVVAQGGSSNAVGEDLPCLSGDLADMCYTVYRFADPGDRKPYNNAEKVCSKNHGEKGRLVTIPNRETQRWLETKLKKVYGMNSGQLWIGAKFIDDRWTWHGEGMQFINWANGQPVNESNRYGFIETLRTARGETQWIWMTDRGASSKDFICEYIDNRCGRPKHKPLSQNRVTGGVEAKDHSWPWMVSLQNSNGPVCGGIVISEGLILTAAHCYDAFFRDRERKVVLGIHDLRDENEPYTIELQASKLIKHPGNNKNNNSNDLMVIELEQPITFNHGIKPVCLPSSNQTFPAVGRKCFATGWGNHSQTSQCCPMWVAQRDTRMEVVDGGELKKVKNIDTLLDCQYNCFHRRGCVGINFRYADSQGRRCVVIISTSSSFSKQYTPAVGVDHFSIRRKCAGCGVVWTVYENRTMMSNNSFSSSTAFDVESQYDCQLDCTSVGCDSFNYQALESVGQPNRCELLFKNNGTEEFPREDMTNSSDTNYYEVQQFFMRDYDFTLRQIVLPIVDQQECSDLYPNQVDDSMMCAGKLRSGADTCQGDSGGPLVCEEPDGTWVLHGVTSWGETECGLGNRPGVYARVAPHIDWIKSRAVKTSNRSPTTTPGPSAESTPERFSCDTSNPCTPENVENGWRCFTSSDPNPNKFIFCSSRGRCLPRDISTMRLTTEEILCQIALQQLQHAKSEGGGRTSGFRVKITSQAI